MYYSFRLLIVLLILVPCAALAQKQVRLDSMHLRIDTVLQHGHCPGDPVTIIYTATPFPANATIDTSNRFLLLISDSLDEFPMYGNPRTVDSSVKLTDTFTIFPNRGNYRVKLRATSPFITTPMNDRDIVVGFYPITIVMTNTRVSGFHPTLGEASHWHAPLAVGLAGRPVQFTDVCSDEGKTEWTFGPDALHSADTGRYPRNTFMSPGLKTTTVTKTNIYGCSTSDTFSYTIIDSIPPPIPLEAKIITYHEGSNARYVWVKQGGEFVSTETTIGTEQTVWAESGSNVQVGAATNTIVYLQTGASLQTNGYGQIVLLTEYRAGIHCNGCDTFSVPGFTFEQAGVREATSQTISISEVDGSLHVSAPDEISLRIVNLLGETVLARGGASTIDLDLSSLPTGLYFADVRAGSQHKVNRVVVE